MSRNTVVQNAVSETLQAQQVTAEEAQPGVKLSSSVVYVKSSSSDSESCQSLRRVRRKKDTQSRFLMS